MRQEYNLQEPDFTVKNIDILHVTREENYRVSYRNGRNKHGFLYIATGSIQYTFLSPGLDSLSARQGQLLFIPQGCRYTATYLQDQTQVKIVQFDLSSGQLPPYLCAPVIIDLPGAGEHIDAFFRQIDASFYHLSCLYDLLWQIHRRSSNMPTKHSRLQPALAEMAVNYRENAPISHYAQLCGMSEVTFRRLFRECIGNSPVEYRNDLRLKNARILLQSGEYNVGEAAENAGFSNLSFFIRLYKKKYGYTPKQE